MSDSIYEAIRNNSLEGVKKYCSRDEVEALDGGYNPLHYASTLGNLEMIQVLIDYTENSKWSEFDINTCFEGRDCFSEYNGLAYGDVSGTALTEALINNKAEAAKLLIENGADVNASFREIDFDSDLAFYGLYNRAASYGVAWWQCDDEMFEFCLQFGLDIDAEDPQGNTALGLAIDSHDLEEVSRLLAKGADPNGICLGNDDLQVDTSYLIKAASYFDSLEDDERLEIIKLLIKYGADISYECKNMGTIADCVIEWKNQKLIQFLGLTSVARKLEKLEKSNDKSNNMVLHAD